MCMKSIQNSVSCIPLVYSRFYISYSFFLYSISHPNKHGDPLFDLSKDIKAVVENVENISPIQLKIKRVITRAFNEYSVSYPVDESVYSSFKSKLWRMGQCLANKGSSSRSKIFQNWKESNWDLTVNAMKVIEVLRKEKRKCEHQLASEKVKRQKTSCKSKTELLAGETNRRIGLEKEVLKSNAEIKSLSKQIVKAEKANNLLTKANKNLSAAIAYQHQPTKRRQRKTISTLSRQQKLIRKKELNTGIKQTLSFLEDEGICATSVTLLHKDSCQKEVLDIKSGKFSNAESTIEQSDVSEMILYVKERFGISNMAYHEMSMICKELPRSCNVVQIMNSKWEINSCPGDCGMQQSLKSRLINHVQCLIKKKMINATDTLKVKLSGDGTKVCRKLNVINFTFTLLNEGDIAKSPRGNHTIAIINGCEGYDLLANALSDIRNEVLQLKSVSLDGLDFPIEYFLCSDLKFLAIVCGIESASSNYACVWCKCPSSERYNMKREWSFTDEKKGARTITDIVSCLTKAKTKRFNCAHEPLFSNIPIDHVIPDVLHLLLRVTDVLFNLLILDIRRLDGIEAKQSSMPISRNLSRLESFLSDTCHIPFKFSISKETKQLQWRDLMGPEKWKMICNINLPELFPKLCSVQAIQSLWVDFHQLHKVLQLSDVTPNEVDIFQSSAKKWVKDFTAIYQTKNVTPYIHIMAMHTPEFLRKYTNLVQFTQQGMEKLNDQTTIDFARSTNHNFRNLDALKQLLVKKNRIEQLEDSGCERNSRSMTCSLCNKEGHNKGHAKTNKNLFLLNFNFST